jgi:transposase
VVGEAAVMPRPPLRLRLTADQQAELRARLAQRTLAPRTRARLDCIRLLDHGWAAPQIAPVLGVCEHTVRRALWRFVTGGLDALAERPRPGRPCTLSRDDLDTVVERVRHGHARSVGELAVWLASTRGVRISRTRLGALLRQRGCRWTPTGRAVAPTGAPGAGR